MRPHQTTQGQTPSYADFYRDCAIYPELPKFRRFAAQWTKKLYDDGEALMAKEEELNHLVAKLGRRVAGTPTTHFDYPRRLAKKGSTLLNVWLEYERMLGTYCKCLDTFDRSSVTKLGINSRQLKTSVCFIEHLPNYLCTPRTSVADYKNMTISSRTTISARRTKATPPQPISIHTPGTLWHA